MPEYRSVHLERDGAIDWLTLNRPDQLNAMDGGMCDELQAYFGELSTRFATRVVILRGAGRGFCAGYDIALEDRGQVLCASAGYFEEGIAAFRERRPPVFRDSCA